MWHRLEFELTPSASADCEGIAPGSDPTVDCGRVGSGGRDPSDASVCVRCGGELRLSLGGGQPHGSAGVNGVVSPHAIPSPISLNLDFVWLQPGAWGRFAGLPVLKRSVELLQAS